MSMRRRIRKRRINKNNKYKITLVFVLFVGMFIAYAALTSTLNITGNTIVEKTTWDIHFENLVIANQNIEATLDDNNTTVNYKLTLDKPGDFYEFTVDVVNKGTIEAMVSTIIDTPLTEEQQKYLEYTVTDENNKQLVVKEALETGKSKTLKVTIKYKKDITKEDLPSENQKITLNFKAPYVQADESVTYKKICIRATELHEETCTQTADFCYASGYYEGGSKNTNIITYGNYGTTGTLSTGDAFDCDVNGDGEYNKDTERFYYVNDLYIGNNKVTNKEEFDSKSAVLVYYNNTAGGIPDNTSNSTIAYNSNDENWHGPTEAKNNLPTIEQWSNVNLLNVNRTIVNENGESTTNSGANIIETFSYTKDNVPLAARLLTYQEIKRACGDTNSTLGGYLEKCDYLLENTRYSGKPNTPLGVWLETPSSESLSKVYSLGSTSRSMHASAEVSLNNNRATRPAIEVAKKYISY